TKNGFGLFAFVKMNEKPAPTPAPETPAAAETTKKAPKTDDSTGNPIGWFAMATILSAALVLVIRKSHKTER
ncbi:MAG: LPXTG cell wall anchor domain-containing protein, partial [Christensenellaceae bacterium]